MVGKFTDHFREINKCFVEKYEVRACVNKLEIFKGMFKLNKPDVVVILLNEMNEDNEAILKELQKEHSEIPVVCAGIQIEETKLEELGIFNCEFAESPYTVHDLIEKVEYVLDDNYVPNVVCEETEKEAEEEITEEKEKAEDKETIPQSNRMGTGKKTILLVDDSGIFLRMLNGLLADDYDIRMATSGAKALSVIREKRPDLILLDYEMPLCDGRETMIKIREIEENKDIPIVFVTAVNKKEHIKAVLALKPAGYILKPINRDRLFNTIKDILG